MKYYTISYVFEHSVIYSSGQLQLYLTLFIVSKDEWSVKVDTGKYMKNALYILRYAKRHLRAEAMLNGEKFSAHP